MEFLKWFLCGSHRFFVYPSEILSKLEFQHLPKASNIMKNLFQGKHDCTLISKWIFFHNCFFDFTYKFVYVGYGGIRVLGGADPWPSMPHAKVRISNTVVFLNIVLKR